MPSGEFKKLSVLMPVYNEARTLRTIVRRVLDSPIELDLELVCVDDASTDRSYDILTELAADDDRIKVFRHARNRGKGAAIRTAIEHMSGDVAIVQDSDLEYDPVEYPAILKPILDGRADAVFGSRFAASPERRVLMYWHSLGNKALTWLANVLNDINLTDMETCYKAVRADVLRDLRLRSERFGIEPEITTRLAQWGARIYEVPISYHGRSYAEGKNIGWKDGVQAVWLLFKYRFFDTRFSRRTGQADLESLSHAPRLNDWIMEQFRGAIGSRVLEAGCGIGNLTTRLLGVERLVAVDLDPVFVSHVERNYGHLENVAVRQMDLEDETGYRPLLAEELDTVVSVNVLEHLRDDAAAVRGFFEVLVPGGRACILVPAGPELFSPADEAMGHHRRYDADGLRRLLSDAGFVVESVRPFNRLGVWGWRINRRLGRSGIGRLQARVFSLLVPIARLVDRWGWGSGLSLVAVARKPA